MIVWSVLGAALTVKLWSTCGAAFQFALPAWSAAMVQVPVVRSVTLVPATVHTSSVVELKLTARPEEAVAPTVTGESARVLWRQGAEGDRLVARVMVKLWLCWGAGL